MMAKFKEGCYLIVRKGEIREIKVVGWIPVPNKLPPTNNPDLPLEVVFPYMAKENIHLKNTIELMKETMKKEFDIYGTTITALENEIRLLKNRLNAMYDEQPLDRPVKSIVKQVRAFITTAQAQLDKIDRKAAEEEIIDLGLDEL